MDYRSPCSPPGRRAAGLAAAVAALALACGGSPEPPPAGPPPATKLSGIGDSIMQGFDAGGCGNPYCGEQPDYSFAQGTQPAVNSLYSRYRALGLLAQGEAFVSASGSEMVTDALAQALAICAMVPRPDRVVLLLGGNDVCGRASLAEMYPLATFRAALQQALDTLGAPACGLPAGSRVHVLSMPRVDYLRAAGLAQNDVWCPLVWDAAGICSIVTQETQQSVLDQIGAAIDAYNAGIALEVAAADSAHGGLAGVHFTTDWVGTAANTSIGTYHFAAADVSDIDCFHPSAEGQRRLACIAWETWELGSRNVAACVQ